MPKVVAKSKEYTNDVKSPKKNGKDGSPSDAPDLSVLQGWREYAESIARPKHWEFFVIDQFLRGNHDIKGSADDNSIDITPRAQEFNFPINKIWANFRAVRAFVTRNKPVINIETDGFSEESKTYARRANKLLERDNKLNNSHKLNKEWAYYGIKYGVGYRQIGYDQEAHRSIRWSVDPFDLLPGSQTGKFEDSPFIIKDIVRTIGYWRNKYPNGNVSPDNRVAADQYKELAVQINQLGSGIATQRVEEQTAIGHEVWYRLFKPNKLGGLINKCLYVDSGILDMQETPYKDYPFVAYESEILPNEMYPDGHIKNIIAPQRMLNLLNTQLLEYNHVVNRGRYQVPKGAGFEVIQAKEGQIIRYNQGKRIESLPPAPVNPLLLSQLQYADESIQIIGAQNNASQGATPQRVSSGQAIQALQTGDSNNISDLRDNFEDALAREAEMILTMYNLFESDGFMMEDKLPDGEVDKFAVGGANMPVVEAPDKSTKFFMEDNGSYLDYLQVGADNNVKVSVTSEFGETKEARQELLFRLVELGMPLKFVFKYLELPDGDEILERIAEENVAEIAQQMMMQQQQAQAGAEGQPGPLPGEGSNPVPRPDEDIAAVEQQLGQ